MSRTIHLLSLVVLLAFLVTACGGGATPAPAATEAPAPTVAPTEAPAPTAAPAPTEEPAPTEAPEEEESEEATPAGSTEEVDEIFIGAIHPLSGGLAQDGAFLQNGIDLAVEEINSAGGIQCLGGAMLRVEHADSQGRPEVGQSEAERLIGEGAVALLGTYQSAVTLNATQIAEREQIPFIVTVASANEILSRGFKYTFRIQPDQTQMTIGLLTALEELRAKGATIDTAVVVHEDSLFGTGFADLLKTLAPEYNLQILEAIPYSLQGLTDVTTELSRAQALNPDIIIPIGYLNDGILIARTAQELQISAPLIGLSNGAFSTQQFIEQVGDTANYIMDANYHYDATNPAAIEVRDRYREKFGADMPTHGVMAYEAIYILADALNRACSTDSEALRNALAETSYEDHILPYEGPITFDETGQAANALSVLMQIQDGQIYQVAPASLAETDPIFPPPPWSER